MEQQGAGGGSRAGAGRELFVEDEQVEDECGLVGHGPGQACCVS